MNKVKIKNTDTELEIVQGDITKVKVDVIVNAANKTLLGGGGVDGAIHRAAGKELLEECRTLNGAETGEVKGTGAYKLDAKKIFHTPGPIWSGGNNREGELLRNSWLNSLELAKKLGLHSIAFPSISTGVYGFPLDEAAEIAIRTIMDFAKNPTYSLYILIVAFDQRTKTSYEKAWGNI